MDLYERQLNYQLVPHTVQKFWKMIVSKAFQIRAKQNAVQQTSLYSHHHWQILDRLNRRKQIDFCAKKHKKVMKSSETWIDG